MGMEGPDRDARRGLVLTWILTFCLTVLALLWHALHRHSGLWVLPILAGAAVAAVNWHLVGRRHEWLTTALVWNLCPMFAAAALNYLGGFLITRKIGALLAATNMAVVYAFLVYLLRRERRQNREDEEWGRKFDAEMEALTIQERFDRLSAEVQALSRKPRLNFRRLLPIAVLTVVLGTIAVLRILFRT